MGSMGHEFLSLSHDQLSASSKIPQTCLLNSKSTFKKIDITLFPSIQSCAMTSQDASKVFVIGGTGAQGIPVIKSLVSDKKYSCLILTRDPNSSRAQSLVKLPNVELLTGTFTDESA